MLTIMIELVVKLLIMIKIMMGLLRNTKTLPLENHPLCSDEYMFLENVFYLFSALSKLLTIYAGMSL